MKHNRTVWGLVSLVVLITCVVCFAPTSAQNQESSTSESASTPRGSVPNDQSKYAVIDYEAPLPSNLTERQERWTRNNRYDNMHLVTKNPGPKDTAIIRHDDAFDYLPTMPESKLIVTGQIVKDNAYLSNDKHGVYSEFKLQVDEVIRSKSGPMIEPGSFLDLDREGGIVRYAKDQKVLYMYDGLDLPKVGVKYIFFLDTDSLSPNYKILTGYSIDQGKLVPLDDTLEFRKLKTTSASEFLRSIRAKLSESPIN